MKVEINCPFYLNIPFKVKGKNKVSINLNNYRNWHRMTESKIKKHYSKTVGTQLQGLRFNKPIEVTYKVYKPTGRRLDKGNVLSVTQKYLLDALTEHGCIPDDNDDFVKREVFESTELDRDNPRVSVVIKTLS